MNYLCFLLALLLYSASTNAENTSVFAKVTYETLYKAGVDAYLENRWDDCALLIEKSIEDYIYFRTVTVLCRKRCNENESESAFTSPSSSVVWQLQAFITNKALCLMKCQNLYFPNRPKVSKETDEDFNKKVPYNYLQLCYFKLDEPEKAASCAYTFLIHNPGHEVMKANLKYYMAMPNLDVNKIKYLEPKNYQDLFLKGAQLYSENLYKESIQVMEMSIKEYLAAEDECRYLCEGSTLQLSSDDLFISMTNQLTFSLRCKLNCPETLSYMYGQKHDDLFPSHYHYLQFNYYQIEQIKKTCETVASFLLFHPDDKTMLSNKNYYLKKSGVPEDWFVPRKGFGLTWNFDLPLIKDPWNGIWSTHCTEQTTQEAQDYVERYQSELKFLKEIEKNFQFAKTQEIQQNSLTPPPGLPSKASYKRKIGKKREKLSDSDVSKWFEKTGIETVMNEKDLNGTQRVLFSNLLTQRECEKLVQLAVEGGVHGDGYNGKESPHTEFEMFEGLTVARAAILYQRGILDPVGTQLFLNISEKARQAVEVYFNLNSELFFAYTHLVCRTALPDSSNSREDLSHPIHADNCVLTPSGKCLKEKPAYIWRDYSSIVYLNEDFDGGEFIFARDKDQIEASAIPKCGHMVAFSAGEENLHGVKAVTKGRRCALAMWYTLDSNHRERERDFAKFVLENMKAKQVLSSHTTVSESFEKTFLFKFANEAKQKIHDHDEL